MPCWLLNVCLVVLPGILGWAESAGDRPNDEAKAWQTREDTETVHAFIPLKGGERASRLKWQTARSYRAPTSSAPRAADDPFHDPFGDRTRPQVLASHTPEPVTPKAVEQFQLSPVPADTEPKPGKSDIVLVQYETEQDLDPQPTPAERPTPAGSPEPQLGPFHLTPKSAPARTAVAFRTSTEDRPAPASMQVRSEKPAKKAATPVRRKDKPATPTATPNESAIRNEEPPIKLIVEAIPEPVPTSEPPSKAERDTTVDFRISDPAATNVQRAQFEQWDTAADSSEFTSGANQQLEDLFPPLNEPDTSLRQNQPPATAPQDDTDFNRPFDSEPATDQATTPEQTLEESLPPADLDRFQRSDPDWRDSQDLDSILTPEVPSANAKDTAQCTEVYNDRNCCEEELECHERIELLRTKTLRQISMDITPPFDPLAESREIANQRREEQLARSPSRRWRDQQGRPLGEGRLVDLRNREVILEQSNGQQVAISSLNLGRDERCFISAWWNLPTDCVPDEGPFPLRDFTLTTFTWTASGLCHRPLYFENVQLERYGHSASPWLQPFLSGAHFYSSMALLPYNMGLYPPKECKYALGYYRPGNCAPYMIPAFPISKRAILAETTAIFALYGFLH